MKQGLALAAAAATMFGASPGLRPYEIRREPILEPCECDKCIARRGEVEDVIAARQRLETIRAKDAVDAAEEKRERRRQKRLEIEARQISK